MSRARSVPAFIVENSAPWMNGTASAKARNESVGNPGSSVDALRPPALTSISATGKTSGGIDARRLAQRASDRALRDRADLGRDDAHRWTIARIGCSPAPALRDPPRPSRPPRPRASGRSSRGRRRRASGARSSTSSRPSPRRRSRGRRRRARRPSSRRTARSPVGASGSPNRPRSSRDARALVLLARGDRVDARAPDLGLQRGRRALGDDPAVVDDPDAVGEHVRLLEVLRRQEDGDAVLAREPRDLVPERRAALRVEAGRRLVEEEDARPVDEREREVEPPLHAARVAAHLAVGRLRRARRGRAARSARALRSARGIALQHRLQPQVVAPGEERVERRLLQRGADHERTFGPSVTTS